MLENVDNDTLTNNKTEKVFWI